MAKVTKAASTQTKMANPKNAESKANLKTTFGTPKKK
jgi:hypothetical protein